MATRVAYPLFKAFSSAVGFGVGYKLYTYEAGTDTPLTVYQDSDAIVPHENPIELNSLGEAEIFITAPAKFKLTDADGAVQPGWPVDDISPTIIIASDVACEPKGEFTATNVQDYLDEISDKFASLSSDIDDLTDLVNQLKDEQYEMSNLVKDPNYLLWSVAQEDQAGPAGATAPGSGTFYPLNTSNAWTYIALNGAVGTVVSNDTYITVADITGVGIVTNLFLPGVNAGSDVVTCKLTIDGTVKTVTFTAANATDRFFTGAFSQTYSSWRATGIVGGLAQRLDPYEQGYISIPGANLGKIPSLAFETSMKIEMKVSAVNATNYRNKCGAAYYLHP